MPRTGENIYKRKDGRYEARYIAERDANGKAIYKSVYGYSKAEVREKTEAAKVEIYGEQSPIASKVICASILTLLKSQFLMSLAIIE